MKCYASLSSNLQAKEEKSKRWKKKQVAPLTILYIVWL